jgi:hypothetical protein
MATGTLKVYTARGWATVDEMSTYAYGRYEVTTPAGQLIQRVKNSGGKSGGGPETISLPAGDYVITGWSRARGKVSVKATVQPGRLSEVRMDDAKLERVHP